MKNRMRQLTTVNTTFILCICHEEIPTSTEVEHVHVTFILLPVVVHSNKHGVLRRKVT